MAISTRHGTINLLTRINKQIYRRAAEAGLGMHPKQYGILSLIREQSPATQQGLGTALGMDANTIVHLLNSLEEEGWAERRRDPEDRRRHIVALTPKGEKALAQGDERFEALEDQALSELSEADRAKLAELLRRALGDE